MANSTPQQPAKKPYQKPSLKVYGNIQAITGTVKTDGSINDAGFPKTQ